MKAIEAASRLRVARAVVVIWRDAYLKSIKEEGTTMPWAVGTHPLNCVLAAIDGETAPAELGVDADELDAALLAGPYREALEA